MINMTGFSFMFMPLRIQRKSRSTRPQPLYLVKQHYLVKIGLSGKGRQQIRHCQKVEERGTNPEQQHQA